LRESADQGDWDGAARMAETVRGLASNSIDEARRAGATEVLERVAQSEAAAKALDGLAGADAEASDRLVRLLAAVGPALVPALVSRWAGETRKGVRSSLECVVVSCGKPGRDSLRRLLASDGSPMETRIAAARLLELTPGADHLPMLESALSDRQQGLRDVAFDALARSPHDRALDILARGIARAEAHVQASLLDRLAALGPNRSLPVLRRLFEILDPRIAATGVLATMIAALGRAGGEDARPLLADVARRVSWRTPVRAWRVKSAVAAAIRGAHTGTAQGRRGTTPGGEAP